MASFIAADGTSFELADGENLIGRDGRSQDDPPKIVVGPLKGGETVSRRHARAVRRGDRWYLKVELDSRNPTLVGGRVIEKGDEVPLVDDALIQFGDVVLTFRAPVLQPATPSAFDDGGRTIMPVPPTVMERPVPPPPPPAIPVVQPAVVDRPPTATWPGRLPPKTDTLATIGVSEFKRVNPFRGLMIDESAWADAHDYHRVLARLHLLAGHGWGVVEGLEVVADESIPNTVIVRPGVAIDPQGRAILVAQERHLPVSATNGSTLYVSARLREELTTPQRFWNDLDEYTRVVEKCEIQIGTVAPTSPTIELARVTVAGPIRNAVDLSAPQAGEIDLRYRERLLVRPRPDLVVAQLVVDGTDEAREAAVNHQIGLRFLLREIGRSTPYRPRWAGAIRLGDPIPPASLLYLSGSRGFVVDQSAASRFRAFLQAGGVILADGCREGGNPTEFATVIEGLAHGLDRQLKPVGRWHPVLTARHPFAAPPLAVAEGITLTEGDGIVLTTADYGCSWVGGRSDAALPRETVRSALELGVNVAVYGRQRQRPLEAIELE